MCTAKIQISIHNSTVWSEPDFHSSFAITLMGKRKLVALLSLSSWRLVVVVWLFLTVPLVCLQFRIVVFPDHTHYFRRLLTSAIEF